MLYLCLIVGIGFLSILLHLTSALRLGIPALYVLLVCTVFSQWYDTHEPLADSILFVMLICVALSWLISLFRFVKRSVL